MLKLAQRADPGAGGGPGARPRGGGVQGTVIRQALTTARQPALGPASWWKLSRARGSVPLLAQATVHIDDYYSLSVLYPRGCWAPEHKSLTIA